ncbi:MFS transporter [Planomonospora sp. ID91781]|uniref:Cinnamoyl-CoA reductase n=1 Tax=Planomonospora sphaerica TaxID=161355 RepID=A0A171CS92_9ACTN|nr:MULTISPECIES: MFS transporter [Planomonospora]MBG0823443.1 MFS transporter [Planomonospora sp. ID91781]GAT67137.1 cinnamoyl-CoA reductase [Planomonospora sphaerica]
MTGSAVPEPRLRRSVAATVVGNFVEYFDWLAYGLFAPLFAAQFFPAADPVTSLLGAFAVFAAGMLFRPLGGILFGRLADRRGRRPALLLSIALMAAGSTLIGVAPTYEQIGVSAALLLLLARAAQGLSSGGEWPAAVTYLMELAAENRKCFYGGLFSMTASAGAFLAALLGGGLSEWLGPAAMTEWGWRVPFLLGGVFGVILLLARNRLAETAVFEREVRPRPARGSFRRVLVGHRRQVLLVVLFVAGLTTVIGTWSTVVPAIGHRIAPPGTMFWAVVLVNLASMAVMPFLGRLADRVGERRFLTAVTLVFAVAGPYTYLGMAPDLAALTAAYGSGVLYMGCVTAVMPKMLAAVFPPDVRGLGIGLPHGLTTAVLGGLTPSIATYLDGRGLSGWYVAGVMATVLLGWLAAVVATRRPAAEPYGGPAPRRHEPAGLAG